MQETSSSAGTCPADEVLKSLARGRLSTAGPWLSHVDQCQSCRDRFDAILNSSDAQATFASEGSFTSQLGSNSSDSFGDRMRRALGGAFAETQQVLRPPESPDELGRLGPYRVLELLGSGGMGLVLLAEETALNRRVALKVMRPHVAADPIAHQRFLREARAMAQIEHDHVVPIYRVDEDRGVPYVAMPLLQGESLAAGLARTGRLPSTLAIEIGRQIAEGLAAAHAKGLVHRDVKPANVWLEPRGEDSVRVRLLDFGLARAVQQQAEISHSGAVVGTPAYMSPEQAQGQRVDERSDLFSLGVILYRMATGKSPFVGDDPIVVIRQVIDVVPARPDRLVPGLRAGLSNLIMRLLEKDPAKRPGSAREVAKELAELETGWTRQTSKRLRNIIVVGVAIAACCAWAVGLGIVFRPKPKESIQSAAQWDSTWHLDPSRIRESERWPNQPPELVAVIGAQTRRHWGPVHAVSSAENGSMLVTDSPGDGVRFWNPQTMAPLGRAPSRQDFIRAIAVTRDGKRFITTNRNGQFEVWDIDPPTAKRSVPLIYSDAPVGGIVIDSTGSRVFVSDFADGTVREYSLSETELKPRRVFKEKLGEAWSLAISPDGHWLAASSKTGAVGVWDLQESEPRFRSVREKSRGDNFVDLVFARDSKSLYLVSQGTRNAVYDLSTGGPKKFVDFTSGTDMPWAAYIDGSGKRLIRVGQRSVAVYNLGNNMPTVIRSIEVPFAILGAAYDPRLERVYTGHDDGGVRAWDVSGTTPTEIEPLLYQPFARMAVSPDGHFAAIHRKLGGTQAMLDLFDLSGVEPKPAPLPNPAYEAAFGWPAFSDDGKSLFAVDDRSNQISRWDFSGVSAYARILGKTRPSRIARAPKTPRLLCVSADGQRLVNFDLAGSSHFVVDANGRSQPLTAGENSKGLVIVDGSFDSDGDGILALGKQGEAGRLIHWKSPDRSPKVKSLPEGISWRWLLVARKEETILGVGDRGVFELAIDWDAKLPRQVFDLEADDANVRALAVSGDGKRLAIATGGGRLVVQDRSTHVIKYDWRLPGAPAQIAFTLNGSGLITANPNGAVYVFRLDLNQP